uniref:RAD51 interacting motif domain-containing protein n=1 Tax=Schistocephalus solidus TaxID=70667 RepID=A0A0X3NP28_SCHSO
MDEGRKSRQRKRIDYSKLLSATDDDDTDDDFFPQDSPPHKKVAFSSGRATKSDQKRNVREVQKSSKAKKPESSYCKAESILATEASAAATSNHSRPPLPATPQPPSNIRMSASSSSVKTLPTACYSSAPSTPANSRRVAFCVTPSSGLRLGLSRRGASKPLHTNIRLAQ